MFILVQILVKMNSKKAQVWVETVVYTLIVFAMIGLVLSFVKPKIDEGRDKAILEQSKGIMEKIDNLIQEIKTTPGNKRVLHLTIKKGSFNIDSENNRIFFEMDSQYRYSEPGTEIEEDGIIFYTKKKGDTHEVNATMNYDNYNITFEGKEKEKSIHSAPQEYKLVLFNEGKDDSGNTVINFELE